MGALLAAGIDGCGVIRRGAITTMTPIIGKTIQMAYRDQDLETVGRGLPGNLLLIRGMCEENPGDRQLWTFGTQLYYSYGYAFIEDDDPEEAILIYRQGLDLGLRALERGGWFLPERDIDTFCRGLRKARPEHGPLLFWTLANWVNWIDLTQCDPASVAQLPYAEAALERLLEIDPNYFLGMPHVMLGTLLASKPAIAGGKPEEARRQFEAAFTVSKRRLLIFQVFYAQYYCRQVQDRDGFISTLNEVLNAQADKEPNLRLLNEVAKRKAARLMELKDEWF